jgi:hypothetical protein
LTARRGGRIAAGTTLLSLRTETSMELVEIFKQLTVESEKNLTDTTLRQEGNLQRREALRQIQDRFEQMSADGYIDPKEMQELMSMLASQGLDASSLAKLYADLKGTDSSVSAKDGSDFEEAFEDLISDAKHDIADNESDTQFEIQMHLSDATHYVRAASQLLTAEHKVYMHIIGNCKA